LNKIVGVFLIILLGLSTLFSHAKIIISEIDIDKQNDLFFINHFYITLNENVSVKKFDEKNNKIFETLNINESYVDRSQFFDLTELYAKNKLPVSPDQLLILANYGSNNFYHNILQSIHHFFADPEIDFVASFGESVARYYWPQAFADSFNIDDTQPASADSTSSFSTSKQSYNFFQMGNFN